MYSNCYKIKVNAPYMIVVIIKTNEKETFNPYQLDFWLSLDQTRGHISE